MVGELVQHCRHRAVIVRTGHSVAGMRSDRGHLLLRVSGGGLGLGDGRPRWVASHLVV